MSNEPVPHEWELLASLAEVLPVNAVAAGGGGGDGVGGAMDWRLAA